VVVSPGGVGACEPQLHQLLSHHPRDAPPTQKTTHLLCITDVCCLPCLPACLLCRLDVFDIDHQVADVSFTLQKQQHLVGILHEVDCLPSYYVTGQCSAADLAAVRGS